MGHCYKRRKIRKTIPYCTLFEPFLVQTSRSGRETKVLRELSFFIDVLISFYSAAICSYSISTVSGGVLIFFFNPWFFETFFTFMVATKTYLLSLLWVKLNCVIPHNPQVFELSRTHLSSPEGSKILYLRFAGVFVVWTYSPTFDYTEK